jgi:hypothetical protein
VSLTPSGVYPASITRQQGEFILFVRNRLASHANTYTLSSADSGVSSAVNVSATLSTDEFQDYAYQSLNLAPGEYVLTFKNNPQYSVKLTVTAP